jgi:hypothetical protein
MRKRLPLLLTVAALGLAGGAGLLTAVALGQGEQQPTRTVTVDVGTGERGPPGPQGPPGPPGGTTCPPGFTFAVVVFNAPGGQTRIATCLAS